MSVELITELILQYRYWILIPLSLIEGPVVAFVAGTLASLGFFDMYFLAVLFFVRDVGLDGAYYATGYFGKDTAFAGRMLAKIGITDDHLDKVHELWRRRPFMTMFMGKLSYGVASAFIVVAGMVKLPLGMFFRYGAIVAILEYGTLLFAGYFLGASLGGSVAHIISNVQYAIAFTALAITGYYLLSWYLRGKLLKSEKDVAQPSV